MTKRRTASDPRVVDGTYWNGYWGKLYVVEAMGGAAEGTPWWRVRWEDGRVTTHSTAWSPRTGDRVVDLPDNLLREQNSR